MYRCRSPLLAFILSVGALTAADDWRSITAEQESGLPSDEINFVQQGPGPRIWIGTASGVTRYDGERFAVLTNEADEPLGSAVWDVTASRDGRVVLGTQGGVLRIAGNRLQRPLVDVNVGSLVPFGERAVWGLARDASERNTLVGGEGGTWSPVEIEEIAQPVDLFAASNGRVWVINDGNGVVAVDPADRNSGEAHLDGLNLQSIAEDDQGRIWVGRWGGGVLSYDGEDWTTYLESEEAAVVHIEQAADGSMWFGTTASGVYRLADGDVTQHLEQDGPISVLKATSDGRVWVSSQATRGLKYWNGEEWVLSLDTPMPISCLAETRYGLWAGGVLDGLHILREDQ